MRYKPIEFPKDYIPKHGDVISEVALTKKHADFLVYGQGLADCRKAYEAFGYKFLDAERLPHGAGSSAPGKVQLPVGVVVRRDEPAGSEPLTEAAAREISDRTGLTVEVVDSWVWRVRAGVPRAA